MITDTTRIDFYAKHAGHYVLNIGDRWYFRAGPSNPMVRCATFRGAVDTAIYYHRGAKE